VLPQGALRLLLVLLLAPLSVLVVLLLPVRYLTGCNTSAC
jgi:hypothetical protein